MGVSIDEHYTSLESKLNILEEQEKHYMDMTEGAKNNVYDQKRARFDMETELEQLKIQSEALEKYNEHLQREIKITSEIKSKQLG